MDSCTELGEYQLFLGTRTQGGGLVSNKWDSRKRRSIGTLLTPKHGLVSYVIIRTVSEWPQIHYLVKSMARVFSISHRGIKPSNIPIILTENLQSAQQQRANSSS